MTRKERLEYELSTGESILEEFERYVPVRVAAERILQAEREVWERAAEIVEEGRFISDSSLETQWAKAVTRLLRQQREGL